MHLKRIKQQPGTSFSTRAPCTPSHLSAAVVIAAAVVVVRIVDAIAVLVVVRQFCAPVSLKVLPAFLAHTIQKVSNIVSLTALRLAFFIRYG